MFKDNRGCDCFIDLEGRLHHTICTEGVFLSYENILKNITKLDPYDGFFTKQYNEYGMFIGEYRYVVNSIIMYSTLEFTELVKIHHPQLLI